MIRADLHAHTSVSDGLGSPELLVRFAVKRGMNLISVTDHNTFLGSRRAADYAGRRGIPLVVLPGAEFRVRGLGDFLTYCPSPMELIGPLRSLGALLRAAERNGCVVVPAHPLNVLMHGSGLLAFSEEFEWLECYNSWTAPPANLLTYILARRGGKRCLASSDAHVPEQLGIFHTVFDSAREVNGVDDALALFDKGAGVSLYISYPIGAYLKRLEWSLYRNLVM